MGLKAHILTTVRDYNENEDTKSKRSPLHLGAPQLQTLDSHKINVEYLEDFVE